MGNRLEEKEEEKEEENEKLQFLEEREGRACLRSVREGTCERRRNFWDAGEERTKERKS